MNIKMTIIPWDIKKLTLLGKGMQVFSFIYVRLSSPYAFEAKRFNPFI